MARTIRESISNLIMGVAGRINPSLNTAMEKYYASGQEWVSELMRGGLATGDFMADIYNDEILTPHNEMLTCTEMRLTNTFIEGGGEILKNLLIGTELTIECEDDLTREWLEKWIERTGLWTALEEAIENYIFLGNGYIERRRELKTGMMVNGCYEPVPRAERIWKMPSLLNGAGIEDGGKHWRYYEEVPKHSHNTKMKKDTLRGSNKPLNVTLYYEPYDTRYTKMAYDLGVDRLIHFPWGIGPVAHYGRSPLACAVSDYKIMREIERSIAVIARHKAIPKKILELCDWNEEPLSPERKDEVVKYLNNLSDMENPVANGVKINPIDLSYGGAEVSFVQIYDAIKQKLTAMLVPSFYLHGGVTNYAVALEQKMLFQSRIESKRKLLLSILNKELRMVIVEFNSLPPEDRGDDEKNLVLKGPVSFKFGDYDIDTKAENRLFALNEWREGVITLGELRDKLGEEPLEDEDLSDAFKHELGIQSPPGMGLLSPRQQTPIGADHEERKKYKS